MAIACRHIPPYSNVVTGSIEVINGVKTYVATPKREYAKEKAILFLPDVFGIEFINAKVGHIFSTDTLCIHCGGS